MSSGTSWADRSQEYRDRKNELRRRERRQPAALQRAREARRDYQRRIALRDVVMISVAQQMPRSQIMKKHDVSYEDVDRIMNGLTPKKTQGS